MTASQLELVRRLVKTRDFQEARAYLVRVSNGEEPVADDNARVILTRLAVQLDVLDQLVVEGVTL